VNPGGGSGGGSGRDEPPLGIQIPDDARELARDVLAYHREQRVQRRRDRLRKLTAPFGGEGTVMPLLASILAVCLVAGAMLSVATFGPSTAPATQSHPATGTASSSQAAQRSSSQSTAPSSASPASVSGTAASGTAVSGTAVSGTSTSGHGATAGAPGASPSGASASGASPSVTSPPGSVKSPAGSGTSAQARHTISAGAP
jgi:hypothetical protein